MSAKDTVEGLIMETGAKIHISDPSCYKDIFCNCSLGLGCRPGAPEMLLAESYINGKWDTAPTR